MDACRDVALSSHDGACCIKRQLSLPLERMSAPNAHQSRSALAVLNVFAAAAHIVSASLGLVLTQHGDPKVSAVASLVEFQTATQGSVFRPTPQVIFTTSTLKPYVAVEFITAGFHIIYLTALLWRPFDALLRRYVADTPSANPLRWVEYGITATIMGAFGSLNVGITSFYYFLKLVSSGVCLQLCGYIIELLDNDSARDRRLFKLVWMLGTLLNIFTVAIMLYQIFASKTHQTVFYYNVVPFSIWFQTFGVVAQLAFKKWRQFADPFFTERWYIMLSLSTKLAVFWLSFSTYRQIAEENGFAERTGGVNWTAVRFVASYVPLSLVFGAAVWDAVSWSRRARKAPLRNAVAGVHSGHVRKKRATIYVL